MDALQAARTGKNVPQELRQLSPLELRLVREIAQGETSREMAAALDLSGRTVENYRTPHLQQAPLDGAKRPAAVCPPAARNVVEAPKQRPVQRLTGHMTISCIPTLSRWPHGL